jgi:hypothetical protein
MKKPIAAAIAVLFIFSMSALSFAEQGAVPAPKPNKPSEHVHNSYAHQTAIDNYSDQTLGEIAKEQSTVDQEGLAYGFAAKSEEAKFFLIGSLYSEALAYLFSGDNELAAERLKAVEREFIVLQVPPSLYNYLTKMRSMLTSGKHDPKLVAELLSLFQPFFEEYAEGQSTDKLTLFRAGIWLFDMGLTAAAGDLELLHQAGTLEYFTEEMERMDAPVGVMRALDDINDIVKQEKVSDRDVRNILKLVKRIQTILG